VPLHAPAFGGTFAAISAVMTIQEGKLAKKSNVLTKTEDADHSNPPAAGRKRTRPESLTSLPAKRSKGERETNMPKQPTTPDQPTNPADPDRTGDTSITAESQPEPATDKLLYIFLGETIRALKRDFGIISWQRSGHSVFIDQTYIL
jgi:hypothetical protein